jgi:hypothetical protein
MSEVNTAWNRAGTILSDGINNFFYLFVCFMALVQEFNCHTVYSVK